MLEEKEFCINIGYDGQSEEFSSILDDVGGNIQEAFGIWTNILYTRFKYLSEVNSLLFACNPDEVTCETKNGFVVVKVPKFIKERLERI